MQAAPSGAALRGVQDSVPDRLTVGEATPRAGLPASTSRDHEHEGVLLARDGWRDAVATIRGRTGLDCCGVDLADDVLDASGDRYLAPAPAPAPAPAVVLRQQGDPIRRIHPKRFND